MEKVVVDDIQFGFRFSNYTLCLRCEADAGETWE